METTAGGGAPTKLNKSFTILNLTFKDVYKQGLGNLGPSGRIGRFGLKDSLLYTAMGAKFYTKTVHVFLMWAVHVMKWSSFLVSE